MAEDASEYPASYAAFFAPRSHVFDTVDFRVPASLVNLRTYFATTTRQRINQARLAGLLGLFIGIVFAIIGFAVDQLTRGLTLAVYRATDLLLQSNRFWPAVVVFTLISLVYVLIAALMVVYIAPLGAGSGIPELKSYLNGVRVPGFLAINSLFVKAIGIAFSIASGLICGKQGPMIHAGAIVGAGLSQGASSRFAWRVKSSLFRFLRTEPWKRDFAAVGAGVGIAVAFGSPMGAWMWVFEEACTHWTWSLGILTLGGCMSGAIVVRILNYCAMRLPGTGFGLFTLTQFGKLVTPFDGSIFFLKDSPAFVIIGLIGGICGALLPLINKYITLFRYKRVKKPVRRLLETAVIAILTALFRILIPYLADDCRDVDPGMVQALQNAPAQDFSRFTCPPSQFSPWAAAIYNPSDSVVRSLLYSSNQIFSAGAIAVAFLFYMVFIIWTYGIAVPAGVFFPGFLLGSVYGRLIGIAVAAIFPTRTDVSLSGYAFLGAVSALAGFTRNISVAVIALEATGSNDASFAAVFVTIIAKLVADFLYKRGIYDLHIDLKGIPFLSKEVPQLEKYYKTRVADVMSSHVIGVRRLSKVSGLLSTLEVFDHNAYPVFVKLGNSLKQNLLGKRVPESHNEGQGQGQGPEFSMALTDCASVSTSSMLEADLDKESGALGPELSQPVSSIITPHHRGMQATIFDDGDITLVNLGPSGEPGAPRVVQRRKTENERYPSRANSDRAEATQSRNKSHATLADYDGDIDSEQPENVQFQLMGAIDRGTILALLKHECDKKARREQGEAVEDGEVVAREDLDSAWPNRARLKGEWEKSLIQRVKSMKLEDKIIDLRQYVDPDPLLMSDKAITVAAYQLFRQTGSRHILVVNSRVGQVVGIVTRKDVLPASIDDALNKYNEVKTD